jgi:hypothetical protein
LRSKSTCTGRGVYHTAPTKKSCPMRTDFRLMRTMNRIQRRYLRAFKCLVSSIKAEVKKKDSCTGRTFSCFAAHLMEQDLF